MISTYQELKEIVPEKTLQFIKNLLPYLDFYKDSGNKIAILSEQKIYNDYLVKQFLITLVLCAEDPDMGVLFEQYNISKKIYYPIADSDISFSKLFRQNRSFLPEYDDLVQYEYMLPIHILNNTFQLFKKNEHADFILNSIMHGVNKKSFGTMLQSYIKEQEESINNALEEKLVSSLPTSVISYLETASRIQNYFFSKSFEFNEELIHKVPDDLIPVCLLLSTFYYRQTLNTKEDVNINEVMEKILNNYGIEKDKILSIIVNNNTFQSIDFTKCSRSMPIIQKYYQKYYKHGTCEEKEPSEITVPLILMNVFNRNMTDGVVIERILSLFQCPLNAFENFDVQVELEIEKEKIKKKYMDEFSSYPPATHIYLELAFSAFQIVMEKIDKKEIDSPLLKTPDDILVYSLISSLSRIWQHIKHLNPYRLFEKNKITLSLLNESCGLREDYFECLYRFPYRCDINYELITPFFEKYLKGNQIFRKNQRIEDIIKMIFSDAVNPSPLLQNLITMVEGNYDILKREILTEKDYELSLSVQERIDLLEQVPLEQLQIENMKSILQFGNTLSFHSSYIQEKLPKLILSDHHDESVDNINAIIGEIFQRKKPREEKLRSFLKKIFLEPKKEDTQKQEFTFENEKLQELTQKIEENIESLSKELLEYHDIRRYIEAFQKKNLAYYASAKKFEEEVKENLAILNPKKEEEYGLFLRYHSLAQTMEAKVNRFATTNHVMQQELFKVNQAISNHFITMEALQMAKDALLPIILFELALGKGQNTEEKALQLSHNVMDLLQSLLMRNVDGAIHHMELLKSANLPEELLNSLNAEVNAYLGDVNQAFLFNSKQENSNPFDYFQKSNFPFSLTEEKENFADSHQDFKEKELKKPNQ